MARSSVREAWRPAVSVLSLLALAAGGAGLGFACGSSMSRDSRHPLPPAGSDGDDETGLIARASTPAGMDSLHQGQDSPGVADPSPGGGALYGGTLYGDYRFAEDSRSHTATSGRRRGHDPDYRVIDVVDGGAISGRVIWTGSKIPRGERHRTRRQAAERSGSECPPLTPDETVRQDASGHVAGAVVYLEGISRGRGGLVGSTFRFTDVQLGGVLQQHRCRLVPRVQLVSPLGSTLQLIGGAEPADQWTGRWLGGPESKTLFRAVLTRGGEHRARLDRAGVLEVRVTSTADRDDRDDPTDPVAWVVVAAHPYYTTSDRQGRFRLDDVPPGRYTLVVWHPPVARPTQRGRPARRKATRLTAPIARRVRVSVQTRKTTSARVTLSPAR